MGQILAQWWRPVASRVALDLLYWAMRSSLYHLIRMAIGMASKVGAFFCRRFYVMLITNNLNVVNSFSTSGAYMHQLIN